MKRSGFTLSELLIALALIGLIATFTIPKVLQQSSTQTTEAVLKETLGAFNEILFSGSLSGVIEADANADYITSRLNFTQQCPINSNIQGCYTTGPPPQGLMGTPKPNQELYCNPVLLSLV